MRENISAFINSRRFIAVFAILTIMFGGLWMAHTQMNRIPDLWEHVYRVSGITNGDIVARPVTSVSDYHRIAADNYGGKVDWQWISLSDQHRDPFDAGVVQLDSITASDDIGADVPYNNTAVYSPISYLPQIFGFFLGKYLGLGATTTYYLSESIMLLVYTILTTWGIALLPRFRLPMAVLLLSPPVIYHFSFAISADSLTQALIITFSCMLFAMANRTPSCKEYVTLGIIGALIAITKFAYTPLIFIPVALLIVHAPTTRRAKITVGTSVILALALIIGWLKSTSAFVSNPASVSPAEVHERTSGLLHNPMRAISAIWYSISHLQGAFRTPLILLSIWIAFAVVLASMIIHAITNPNQWRISLFWAFTYLMVIGAILATYLAMWLQGTSNGVPGVYIMQLRYLVPLFPVMLLCLLDNVQQLILRNQH
ncbi:DUF2142 domain-containing protein [Bifidobacterium breve]|uniref:DUF2142 domain-containing protein n=1 Tax=Bifidobacterium breve TaxID=1685 RepID=UPI00080B1B76|nr:DUF2142 domain-containing protein [Bifidobacterium breve]